MKKLIILAAMVVPLLGIQKVWAMPISGSIEFSGVANVSGPSTNVLVDFQNPVSIISTTGDYVGADGPLLNGQINFSDINFNDDTDMLLNSPLTLYNFAAIVGGNPINYTFTLTGLFAASRQQIATADTLALFGFGFADITGKDRTPGTFVLGGGGLDDRIVFTARSTASVPDGGATVLLLGAGLLGLAFAKHHFSVRNA